MRIYSLSSPISERRPETMNDSAECIQRRMEDVRNKLDDDVEEIVDSARQFMDWHTYVEKYPWVCVGLATAIGYFVVPKRLRLNRPDATTFLEMAKKNKQVVEANPAPQVRDSMANKLFGFVLHAAMRGAAMYLGQKLRAASGLQDVHRDRNPLPPK